MFLFQAIDYKVWSSKMFLFQAILFIQTVLIQLIQFSINVDFFYIRLNIKTVQY